MDKEQQLYDKFVDTLIDILDDKPTAQYLSVILNFLKYKSIPQAQEEPEEELEPETNIKLPF